MATSSRPYDLFLSYNTRDHAAVERVGRWLKDHGLACFMDRWYLVPGTPWPVALEAALQQSRAVAVFLGPGEMGRWQQREQYLALNRQASNSLVNAFSPLLWPEIQDEVDRREKANEKTASLEKGTLSLRDLVEIALNRQPGTQRLLLVVDQWEELYTL